MEIRAMERASSFWSRNYSAEKCRAVAEQWDHLAILAGEDGDTQHAAEAKREAAQWRQKAREMETAAAFAEAQP